MVKLISLLKLLPKYHQILLSLLIFITLAILLIPTDDAQASRSTNHSLSGNISLADKMIDESPSTNRGQVENSDAYPVPLASRKPTPPSTETIVKTLQDKERQHLPNTALHLQLEPEPQLIEKPVEPVEISKSFTVQKGDTLAVLFKRAGLTPRDVYDITQLPKAKKNLLKIIPGEEIVIVKTQEGELKKVRYLINAISTLEITKEVTGYHEQITSKEVESRNKFAKATINSNFWNAGVNAGLTPNQIMQLATIFGWDIDFALDIRKGDNFAILFEEEYANGEFLRNGNILAAEFINQGDRYTAVRYSDGNYYSEEGQSMRKAFLRSPVDFKYVSSNFNPRRLHPVTGQVKAHRGVDYVAAVGTPIKSAGNGRVTESGYNKYNGHYVFIKHNETYTTKYLHLHKRNVKKGQSVKQGQIIGTLGASGRVTGAHLHYEFIVNGVHHNPRTIKLPQSLPIDKKEKTQFLALSKQLMAKLEQNKQLQLAAQ